MDPVLLANTLVAGLLVGGFYAGISVGLTISFGMLDIVNVAHPAFIVLGAYLAFLANDRFGIDPLVSALVLAPLFALGGAALYRLYYVCFERRGEDSLAGPAFFLGILFIVEVGLVLLFGVDLRMAQTGYSDAVWRLGALDLRVTLVIPFLVSIAMIVALRLFFARTFLGRAVMAVAQDRLALRLMGVDAVRVRRFAFCLSLATAAITGACLIMIQPVQPAHGREYIALIFAICVLGGMGSITGTLVGALILGVAETFTATYSGPSWAPMVSFSILLLALAFRPAGLFGR
ncbi:MAG: branched-chain amino acid ABC transporter permease [Burkholderiaceae bacterium]|nr:branched-chain amino acid ABC transporter permease [Burkholderiaceae bacterium]